MADRRFPRAVYRHGTEPDPRFSLANERTFLAWVRTSLALFAAGVALEALQVPIDTRFRLVSAVVFIALGMLCAVQALLGWMATERAMRLAKPLPGPLTGVIVIGGVLVGILAVAIGSLV